MKNLSYKAGHLILNRPEKLNCLNFDLIQELNQAIDLALQDKNIENVFLSGEGKAFCAGGDVVELVQNLKKSSEDGLKFFAAEYQLDYRLATLSKPLWVFAHGAVMGGGLGLYHGAYKRILDPGAILAMPEITIGLFPDVGATYFLNKLPTFWGLLLGLTGLRISAGVAKLLGLADHLAVRSDWSAIQNNLESISALDKDPTPQDLHFKTRIESELAQHIDWSDLKSFDAFARGYHGYAPLEAAFKQYTHGSPTSVAVIHHQLLAGKKMSLKQALDQDLLLAKSFLQKPDFFEGVRALLIDKDKNPQWSPKQLSDIDQVQIQKYFMPEEAL